MNFRVKSEEAVLAEVLRAMREGERYHSHQEAALTGNSTSSVRTVLRLALARREVDQHTQAVRGSANLYSRRTPDRDGAAERPPRRELKWEGRTTGDSSGSCA
ncbi:hypothetical protein [Paraburkholderia sp. Ac-20347]|uniref:hypothetical protein n=1 Tax=Paraburkholderia sp. Ac-20347 TaxID=2703892 RepID=UPI0019816842|nr:hypothetical protein [Paraburkholderia sp. Ac-20347]MBN3811038.1 hypothetical protein [Paraburkholderia sp. Ac-20347]